KGGKTALVTLTPKLAEALLTYGRARHVAGDGVEHGLELRSQYGVFNRLRRLCERAEVEFMGVHALRHSAGTRLYRQTGDLGQVQDHLRHATLDMARRYAKSDRRRLRRSLDGWD
ncbi:MAG: tyrosine-type recombinase/integrase, partial [Deinococcales bacterium]